MHTRTAALAITLAFLAGIPVGGAYDRWLHRPLSLPPGVSWKTSQVSAVGVPTAPIPPGKPHCFTDGSVPCDGDSPRDADDPRAPDQDDAKRNPFLTVPCLIGEDSVISQPCEKTA